MSEVGLTYSDLFRGNRVCNGCSKKANKEDLVHATVIANKYGETDKHWFHEECAASSPRIISLNKDSVE